MAYPTREDRSLERHTGADSLLKWKRADSDGYFELPITNVSWNRDVETTDIQHNGSLNATISTTGLRYSGDFEYEGQNPKAIQELMVEPGSYGVAGLQRNKPIRGTLTIKEYNHDDNEETVQTITFKRVIVTSNDRDVSSGDVSTSSFDFEAEDMYIFEGDAGT